MQFLNFRHLELVHDVLKPQGKVLKGFSTHDGIKYAPEFLFPHEDEPEKCKRKASPKRHCQQKSPKNVSDLEEGRRGEKRKDHLNDSSMTTDSSQDSSMIGEKPTSPKRHCRQKFPKNASDSDEGRRGEKRKGNLIDSSITSDSSQDSSMIGENPKPKREMLDTNSSEESENEGTIEKLHEEYNDAFNIHDDEEESFIVSQRLNRNLMDEFEVAELSQTGTAENDNLKGLLFFQISVLMYEIIFGFHICFVSSRT